MTMFSFQIKGKRLAKEDYAEIKRKCTTVKCTLHFPDDDSHDG